MRRSFRVEEATVIVELLLLRAESSFDWYGSQLWPRTRSFSGVELFVGLFLILARWHINTFDEIRMTQVFMKRVLWWLITSHLLFHEVVDAAFWVPFNLRLRAVSLKRNPFLAWDCNFCIWVRSLKTVVALHRSCGWLSDVFHVWILDCCDAVLKAFLT